MPKKKRIGLVIDASIARAAGDVHAVNPRASACRDSLIRVRDGEICFVTSVPIMAEWKKHQSRFARKWLVEMFARRRVVKVEPPKEVQLRKQTARLSTAKARAEVEKDWHLLETALASDHRIISGDDAMLAYLADLCGVVVSINSVHWSNPTDPKCLEWIGAGLPEAPELKLGNRF